MKRIAAVGVGVAVGILLAGPVVAFTVWLPEPLRNKYVTLAVAALVVAVTVRAAWTRSDRRRE